MSGKSRDNFDVCSKYCLVLADLLLYNLKEICKRLTPILVRIKLPTVISLCNYPYTCGDSWIISERRIFIYFSKLRMFYFYKEISKISQIVAQ